MLDVKFKADKSMCVQIGDCGWNAPVNLTFDGRKLYWEKEMKCLGVC